MSKDIRPSTETASTSESNNSTENVDIRAGIGGQEIVEEAIVGEIVTEAKEDKDETPVEPQRSVIPMEGAGGAPANLASDVPTDDSRYIKFGAFFLLLTLGSFSAWAAWVPLSSALISAGEVVVDTYRKSIQHFEGGIVDNIYVRNGDFVKAGDPLIQLDVTQFSAQEVSNRKRLWTTQAELERLRAEQTFATELVFSPELQSQAEGDVDIQTTLVQQQQLFQARLSAFRQEQNALRSRIGQSRQQIAGLLEQSKIFQQQIDSLQKEQQAFSTLHSEGLGDGLRARELNRSILSSKNEKASVESEISRLKIQITETELQIATRKQDFLKDTGERFRQAQSNYFGHQESLQIAADRKTRSLIRSPENGIVVDLQVHTIGAVAPPGQTLLDLVPEKDSFVVEAKLMTQDINDVYSGQLADIRFPAFNTDLTKVIEGEVVNVSADRLIEERDGAPYYLARIKITEQGLKDMGDDMDLKPGMPAEVMIRRAERTFFSYLIKPIADSFARSMKER